MILWNYIQIMYRIKVGLSEINNTENILGQMPSKLMVVKLNYNYELL